MLLVCLVGAVVASLAVTAVILVIDSPDGQTGAALTTLPPSGSADISTAPPGDTTTLAATATSDNNDVSSTTAPTTTTSQSTTSSLPTTTTVAPASTVASATNHVTGMVVVIDPGHQAEGNYDLEPIGPGSSQMKAKVSSGTVGVVTGIPESELVLVVGLRLREALAAHGVQVVMTRTTQDVNLSNIERAQIANEAHADLFVRIHADGSDNESAAGIHVLHPASIKGWTDDIAEPSRKAAGLAQQELVAATGAKDRGIHARSDITGFNWSDVPVILPEIGFMTNPAEDRLLATAEYQDKIVQGLARAVLAFLGVS